MSFDLIAWARPIPSSAEAAEDLLRRYYDDGEDVFEADPALESFRSDVLSQYPALEDTGKDETSPWAMTPAASDRFVEFNLSWHAEDKALVTIVELARKHRVVLYDPQGPDVHSPVGIGRGSLRNDATPSTERRPWFPLLAVGGALVLCFALVLMMALASHATR
jgi:hypothetical protein